MKVNPVRVARMKERTERASEELKARSGAFGSMSKAELRAAGARIRNQRCYWRKVERAMLLAELL